MYGYTKGKILRYAQDDKKTGLFIAYLGERRAARPPFSPL